jgi:hypothetical protein
MFDPIKKKRTRKPSNKPKGKHALIQTRLNSLRPDDPTQGAREGDVIEFVEHLRDKENMSDREFLVEAMLLYRAKWNKGYRPPVITTARLTAKLQESLAMILDHITMLSTLDLTSLRSQPSWNEEHFQKASSHLHESAADFLGQSKRYDDDED